MDLRTLRRATIASLLGALPILPTARGAAQEAARADQDGAAFYAQRIAPILSARCYECHGPEGRAKGGLRLHTRSAFLAGGDSGAVQEGDGPLDASLLLEAIGYEDEFLQMPPGAKLPDEELALLREWIARGAPYGADDPGAAPHAAPEREARVTRGDGRTGWAYRPVAEVVPPCLPGEHPIDALVRERLAAAGLVPAWLDPDAPHGGLADDRALVRRVTYDLTGLPPAPEAVEAYVRDDDPDKWTKLVERLLASPQYGERWGRHWLDVVRYADTNGFERDNDKPNIWRYRDWVVEAFNADLPYDRFVTAQLAGDELAGRNPADVIASGYLRLAQWDDEPGAGALQGRYDVLDDILSTTAQAFLGSTVGCARCHDHKADPFDTVHYYELMAFFHGLTDMSTAGTQVDVSTPEEAARADALEAEKAAEVERLEGERRALVARLLAAARAADGALAAARGPLEGLTYRFYRDTFAVLPDFEMLRPEDSGALTAGYVDLGPRTRDDAIGFVQEGALRVPEDGEYELRLVADDGARVLLGGEAALVLDGLGDAPRTVAARRDLRAGSVPFRLEWFHGEGGAPVLELDWRRVDDARWRYTFEAPAGGDAWTRPDHDDGAWAVGEGGFGTHGTPGADVRTEWSTPAIWLRRAFRWDAGADLDPCLVLHHDEDVEVYVNGVLACRREGYVTQYRVEELTAEARAALRDGANLLAVRCAQTGGGQYVDAAVVPRATALAAASLRDAAYGRRPLTAPRRAPGDEEVERLVDARADALLGPGTRARFRALTGELRAARRREVPRATAFAAAERGGEVPPLHVHVRGNANVLGDPVEPAVPEFLGAVPLPPPTPAAGGTSSGRRAALAAWITHPAHPLTARVMVNRVWLHHFGRGIVATPNDFGELGERPAHPELLDWLAREFVARGWSVKALHRLILASKTYRQSSAARPAGLAVDPANELLWRVSPRRLSAEEVRDTMLAVAGLLNLERGGPPVFGRMPAAALATSSKPEAVWGDSPPEQRNRRTLYVKVKRSLLTPFLVAHDMADVDSSCPARFTTILPTQALQLVNGEFPHELARAFAERLERELPGSSSGADGGLVAARVRRGLELALARPAGADEVADHAAFLAALVAEEGLAPRRALELFCLTLLNLNELVFVD